MGARNDMGEWAGPVFRLSGSVEVEAGGSRGAPKSAAIRGLLSALLLESGRYVDRDRLVRSLWDSPPRSAAVNLRGYVSHLRRELSTIDPTMAQRLLTLKGENGGYALMVDPQAVDIARFVQFTDEGDVSRRHGDTASAVEYYGLALDLWRGPLGQGCMASSSLKACFDSYTALQLTVRERRAEGRLQLGESIELVPELRSMIRQAPFRENSWSLLMRASYLGGDLAGAVSTWKDATGAMAAQYGLDLSPAFNAAYMSILRRDDERVRFPEALSAM